MPASTLRRHLAVLVDAGLVVRRDSPNGKRYARKDGTGEIELAFGFDLSPLVVRSEEFESLAAAVETEARALKLVRERITLCRRDIAKMIATGMEGVPTRRGGQGPADWQEVHAAFRAIVDHNSAHGHAAAARANRRGAIAARRRCAQSSGNTY